MMNSSTPLENVLEAIVNSTQGELGYMHCAIIRKCVDEEGEFLRIIAQSNDGLIDRLNNLIGSPGIQTRRLNYSHESVLPILCVKELLFKQNQLIYLCLLFYLIFRKKPLIKLFLISL